MRSSSISNDDSLMRTASQFRKKVNVK